jgi:hypothetical protein
VRGYFPPTLSEAEQPRTGQLVELADVAVVRQRRHHDVGNIVDVDERLLHLIDR